MNVWNSNDLSAMLKFSSTDCGAFYLQYNEYALYYNTCLYEITSSRNRLSDVGIIDLIVYIHLV